MKMFTELEKLGYIIQGGLIADELDELDINSTDRRMECSLVLDWFREVYKMYITIHQTWYANNTKTAYFFNIEGLFGSKIYDYQDLYDEVLEASVVDIPGKYLDESIYDINIFKMGFAYQSYYETREKAIIKAMEYVQRNNSE